MYAKAPTCWARAETLIYWDGKTNAGRILCLRMAPSKRASCQSTSIKLGWSRGALMHSDGIRALLKERDGV